MEDLANQFKSYGAKEMLEDASDWQERKVTMEQLLWLMMDILPLKVWMDSKDINF